MGPPCQKKRQNETTRNQSDAYFIYFCTALLEFPIVCFIVCQGSLENCVCLCVCVRQGYASTEESLGNCVLLISDMSDMARDSVFPSTAKLKAALRLLFTKQPA